MLTTSYTFSYDESKPNIVCIVPIKRYSYIFGFINTILDELSQKYNIFTISFDKQNTEFNSIKINEKTIKDFIDANCYTKKEYDEKYPDSKLHHSNYNWNIFYKELKKYIPKLKSVDYFIVGNDMFYMLALCKYTGVKQRNYKNEFFDYVGTNIQYINDINNDSNNVVNSLYKYCSLLAFSQIRSAVAINLLKAFTEIYKDTIKSVDTFIIDPAQFHKIYDSLPVPNRKFYFENDNRGTRSFIKFPIAQLQHSVFDYNLQNNKDIEKTKLFFFSGSIFSGKGTRKKIWNDFLNNLQLERSSYFIPLANRIFQVKPSDKILENQSAKLINDDETLYNEVKNHPLYNGYILPEDLLSEIGHYKYGFIARCTSYNDSLNFRPVLYAQNNILPIIDYMYDPNYLSIPKEIQDKISVKNDKDIKNCIEYFEKHDDERLEILNKLKEIFHIKDFRNPNYWKSIINSTWN